MKIYEVEVSKDLKLSDEYAIAIGNFDGIHKGHLELLKEAKKQSENNLKCATMSFDFSPQKVINNLDNYFVLKSKKQKEELLEKSGVEVFFLLNFNDEMKNLSPKDFVEKIIIKNNIKVVICGEDFCFGKDKKGTPDLLKQYSQFKTIVIPIIKEDNEKIASSNIHELICYGEIEKANNLLTKEYSMIGIVVHGNKKGRNLGYATANLMLDTSYRIPQTGVYATKVIIGDKEYYGICNVGHNPTLNYRLNVSVEVHLLDFNEDIYDQEIEVVFYKYLRREKVFENKEELIKQINQDESNVRKYFKLV